MLAFTPTALNLQSGRPVWVDGERRVIIASRPDRGGWIVRLAGVADRAAAAALHGQLLEAPDTAVLRDDPESYFIHELIGLRVRTDTGRELGELVGVIQSGAADVYVVQSGGRQVLFPAIGEVVKRIDVAGGEIVVTPVSGILDEAQ